jgi:hypothetical protein
LGIGLCFLILVGIEGARRQYIEKAMKVSNAIKVVTNCRDRILLLVLMTTA